MTGYHTCWTSKNSGHKIYAYENLDHNDTRLVGTNLFRRENSYGVAREGKLHCKEEGKLRIVCQVEGKLQIVVTSEGKLQSCQEEGKTPYYVVKGKLRIVCQVEEKLQIVGSSGGKLQMVLSSGGKTPNGYRIENFKLCLFYVFLSEILTAEKSSTVTMGNSEGDKVWYFKHKTKLLREGKLQIA